MTDEVDIYVFQNDLPLPPVLHNPADYDSKCKIHDYGNTFICVKKTLKSFLYDITHLDEQPDDDDTLSWLFRRNRLYFLSLLIIIILVLHFFVSTLCNNKVSSSSSPVTLLYWCFVFSFIVYVGLPETHTGRDEAQKLAALFIMTVALWALLCKVSN